MNKQLAAALAVSLLSITSAQANVVLEGNYLKVGVHTSGGIIDNAFNTGITYDETGTGTWTSLDFVKPGSPFEFYSVGFNGYYNSAGYSNGNNFGATTTNTSAGSTLSTHTTGSWSSIGLSQDMWFGENSGTINFSVTLTNIGTFAISDVVYARGLDPDQDSYVYGSSYTTNNIVNGNLVTGSGPYSDWTIGIFSDSLIPHTPSIRSDWSYNPYGLLAPVNDGNGDYTINMAWNVGTLAAGQSSTITFQYRIAETQGEVVNPPSSVPDTGSTLGLITLSLAGLAAFSRRRRA